MKVPKPAFLHGFIIRFYWCVLFHCIGWLVVFKTPENPPSEEELAKLKLEKNTVISIFFTPFIEIANAIKSMPKILWQLALVYLFQWYALLFIGNF